MANCVSGRRTTLLNTTLAENKRRGTKTRRSIFSTKMKFSLLLWTGPETSSTLIYLSSSPRRLFIPFGWIENFSPLGGEASRPTRGIGLSNDILHPRKTTLSGTRLPIRTLYVHPFTSLDEFPSRNNRETLLMGQFPMEKSRSPINYPDNNST